MTGLTGRNVQKALQALEEGKAIIRAGNSAPGRKGLRYIYPATGILRGTSTADVGGYVHQVDVQNLRRIRRGPKTEMERARRAAAIREGSIISGRDTANTASGPKGAAEGELVTRLFKQASNGEAR
jgi:hypothetical protein